MDAKTRDLVLLAAVSFFCAGAAWISDYLRLNDDAIDQEQRLKR